VVYLVYNGENHNLAQRNNDLDYRQRQLEWFDHYLKGNPAAAVVEGGVESRPGRRDSKEDYSDKNSRQRYFQLGRQMKIAGTTIFRYHAS